MNGERKAKRQGERRGREGDTGERVVAAQRGTHALDLLDARRERAQHAPGLQHAPRVVARLLGRGQVVEHRVGASGERRAVGGLEPARAARVGVRHRHHGRQPVVAELLAARVHVVGRGGEACAARGAVCGRGGDEPKAVAQRAAVGVAFLHVAAQPHTPASRVVASTERQHQVTQGGQAHFFVLFAVVFVCLCVCVDVWMWMCLCGCVGVDEKTTAAWMAL